MAKVSGKVLERLKSSYKRFSPIIASAKARDINESDTVTIVTDILEHMFGYDKYSEITSEYAIRGTYCDLALKIDGELTFLLEVKAIGLELKDQHVKQAVDYAANQGIEWVGLTNGAEWRVYKVIFAKPVNHEMILNFNMLDKSQCEPSTLALLTKESWKKEGIEKHYSVQQVLNKFTIGAILRSDSVIAIVKRELKRLSSEVRPDEADILNIIINEVLKREIIEGEKALSANKTVAKSENKSLRNKKSDENLNADQDNDNLSINKKVTG